MGSQRPLKVKQVTVNPPALKPSGEPSLGLGQGWLIFQIFRQSTMSLLVPVLKLALVGYRAGVKRITFKRVSPIPAGRSG